MLELNSRRLHTPASKRTSRMWNMHTHKIATHTLFVVLAAALVLLVATACNRGGPYYVDRGNRLFAEGKYNAAILNYRKALQKDPRSGEAHYRLGLADLKVGNLAEAVAELSRAEEMLPQREDIQVKVADVVLGIYLVDPRRTQTLYDRLNRISQRLLAKNPNSFDGLRLKGYLAKTDGKFKDAEEYFRRANSLKPMEPNVIVPLVETLFKDNQFEEGEKLALELIQKRKDFHLIYDILYSHYQSQNRFAEGENLLKTRINNNPWDGSALLQLAFHYARLQRHADEQHTLERILNDPKQFPHGHLDVGEFYATLQRQDEALREFRAGLQVDASDRVVYLKKIASVLMGQGKTEEAIQSLEQALKEQPKDKDSRVMRSILLLRSGKPENVNLALVELQDLVKQNATDPILRYNLGRAHLAKGDPDAARKQFQDAIRLRNDYKPPRVALLEISETSRDYKEMLRYADEILALDPNSAQARLWRSIGLMGTGNLDQARSELTRLLRQYPQSADVQLQLGLLDLAEKKFKDAEALFRKLYQPGRSDTRPLEGLVRVYVARREFDKPLQMLADALKTSPNSRSIHTMLAGTAAAAGKTDVALEQYRWLVAQYPGEPNYQVRLAEVLQARGDVDGAIAAFQKARELSPKDSRLPAAVAFLEDTVGRTEDAEANYRQALKTDPENPLILNNLAFLLAEKGGKLDEALRLAEQAQRKLPTNPQIADTLGWVYVKKNLNDGAIQIFDNLIRKYPDQPYYRYHLGVALLQKGDTIRAKNELKIALSHEPSKETAEKIKQLIAKIG